VSRPAHAPDGPFEAGERPGRPEIVSDAFASLAHALGTAFKESSAEPWPEDVFGQWAQRVFAHQFETNPVYASYVRKRGVTPATMAHWSEIPWVPASAFKAVPLVSGDSTRVQRVFRTSGTTGAGRRGEHHVLDLDLYEHSVVGNMRRHLYAYADGTDGGGKKMPILALAPAPAHAPESSLSYMLGVALDVLSGEEGGFFVTRDGVLDTVGLRAALVGAAARGTPILLAGTAFAFVHWLEWLEEQSGGLDFPRGSLIMETGGFKGRSRVLERPEFYSALSGAHGVPFEAIVNEYGMTELLSQFYDGPAVATSPRPLEARRHVPPPWVRTRVLDPNTLSALPIGEPGLLCHYDLANAGSVMAVLTEDVGVAVDDGFRLLGRAQGAEARGCSLAMDDLLSGVWV
jgi:hypothetical protein